jgi:glycerophosphoryl diester phosphodiesterase
MSVIRTCGARIKNCLKYGDQKVKTCTEYRDEGHNECTEQRDEGYRKCCRWWPCRWLCKAWVWVSNIVCVVWTWIKDIVCVAWTFVVAVICLVWTIVTFPFCLIIPKLGGIADWLLHLIVGIIEFIVKVIVAIVEGIISFIFHPVNSIGTIISYFGGCPNVRSDVIAALGNKAIAIIGHHGYTKIFPENTSQSCDYAVTQGADGVEIDLCFTADSQVVLWHDWSPDDVIALARQEGKPSGSAYYPQVPSIGSSWRRPVNELTLQEFREHYGYVNREDPVVKAKNDIAFGPRDTTIPTLKEFLAAGLDSRIRVLFLDIKMPGSAAGSAASMIDAIHDGFAEHIAPAGPQVVFMVPDFAVLTAMKQQSEDQGYGYAFTWDIEFPAGIILNPLSYSAVDHAVTSLHNTVASVGRPTSATLLPWRTYRRTIAYDIQRWNEVNANPAAENAGKRIEALIAWTVDDEDELRCLVKMGVGGVITDAPETLASILGRRV